MNTSVQAASAFSRAWVRLYTARLPETFRSARRAEIEADLWDHQHDRRATRIPAGIIASEIVARTVLGVFDDLAWRFEILRVMRRSANTGSASMSTLTSRRTQWMGLAGLVGGLLWGIYFLGLMQRSRSDYPASWDRVVPVIVAALVLTGLMGFRTTYRERIGRKGTIGVALLIASMASYLVAHTLLGILPAGAARNTLGMLVAVGFAILPIPAFILLGLAMKSSTARAGAFLVAVVGPLGMVLPFILAKFGIVNPLWLRPNAPVNLTYGAYFVLAAAWLSIAGYSTYRQAQNPRPARQAQ